jgi:hypothetical protein
MNSDDLGFRDCQQGKRVPYPQIISRGKRKFTDVIQHLNVPGTDTGLFQSVTVKRRSFIGMGDCPLKPFKLMLLQFFSVYKRRHKRFRHESTPQNSVDQLIG